MNITPMLAFAGGDWWEAIPLVIIIFFVTVFIFQLLWNTTMPQIFKLGKITFGRHFGCCCLPAFYLVVVGFISTDDQVA